MFTGIITALGGSAPSGRSAPAATCVWSSTRRPSFCATRQSPLGASIACSGCCLTAVELGADWFAVDASAETLAHTKLGTWQSGSQVNLERSLRVGDELGGHWFPAMSTASAKRVPRRRKTARCAGVSRAAPTSRASSPQRQRRRGWHIADRERGARATLSA